MSRMKTSEASYCGPMIHPRYSGRHHHPMSNSRTATKSRMCSRHSGDAHHDKQDMPLWLLMSYDLFLALCI